MGRDYSLTIVTGNAPVLKNILLIASGAFVASFLAALRRRRRGARGGGGGGGPAVGGAAYETRRTVDQCLQFSFGEAKDVLPYPTVVAKEALAFPAELALLCERHCAALRDFTGEKPDPVALDLGCGVGGATFELAHAFPAVLGVDASKYLINAAQTLKERGWMRYAAAEEGDLSSQHNAVVPQDIDRERVSFRQGDPAALPPELGQFDAVLAANLLCRVADPAAVLAALPGLVRPGGALVLASSYDWQEAATPRGRWLGGYTSKDGEPVWSAERVAALLAPDFEALAEKDLPFLVRHHRRQYSLGVTHATVWRRRCV